MNIQGCGSLCQTYQREKKWEQYKCPSVGDLLNRLCSFHKTECYATIKKYDVYLYSLIQKDFDNILWSGKAGCKTACIVGSHLGKIIYISLKIWENAHQNVKGYYVEMVGISGNFYLFLSSFLVLFGFCTVSIYYLCKQKRQIFKNEPPGIGISLFVSLHTSFSQPVMRTYESLGSRLEGKREKWTLRRYQGQR